LCETLAISCTLAAQKDDSAMIGAMTRSVVGRNPEILSAAVRRADGRLVAAAGDHPRHWGDGGGKGSTPTHMRVPVAMGPSPWGTIEVRFRPPGGPLPLQYLGGSLLPLVAFVGSAGTLVTSLYLRSALRPSAGAGARSGVVPDRVRQTLNTVMEGVLVLDRDQRIAMANDAFAATVGVPAEALRGRRASDLCSARTASESYPWLRSISEGTPQRGAILGLRTNASAVRKVSVNSTSIVGDDGSCRGALATFDDLTPLESKNSQLRKLLRRLRRAQAALRRAKDGAEAANRAKSEFLANVSHEIRTPMNAILGMTEAALDSGLGAEPAGCLEIVRASADSLLSIINDLLDVGKIEAGMLELDAEPFSPAAAVGDAIKTLSLRARQKGLSLTFRVDPAVPPVLIGDGPRLRQVVLNLVGNALKFTEAGGVDVDVRVEPGGPSGGEAVLHLAVTDTGIGIAADKLRSVFEPFTQADGSITRRFGGTGLGLTICTRLAEAMSGRVWVESEVGRGSVFHVVARFGVGQAGALPASATDAAPPAALDAPRLRILLVDDNVFNQKVGTHKLRKMGHDVRVVSGGAEALDALAASAFDVVFMDIQMKDMDGLETTRLLRERERRRGDARRTPVVAMTARAMREDRELCLAAGMDGFVSKPIRDNDLAAALRSIVPHADAGPAPPRPGPARPPTIDLARCLERVGGNAQLLGELVASFRTDCPVLLSGIDDAIRSGSAEELCRSAHTLKSMLLFFEAAAASSAAMRLEVMGRDADLALAAEVLPVLETEVGHLLRVFDGQHTGPSLS